MASSAVMEKASSPVFPHAAATSDHADRLVTKFLYLCKRGARKFQRSGVDRSDLEQVAALGLVKASRRFDETAATPFEAYAWIVILGELLHYVRDHERIVRVPRHLLALERNVANAREAFIAGRGREPNDLEIGQTLGVLSSVVSQARLARRTARTVALDDVVTRAQSPADHLEPEDRILIARSFASLDALERRVIAGIYFTGVSQSELAASLTLTPKRVSRIHLAALSRMRRSWLEG